MNEPLSISPRQRMQELLAIPDNDRTDEEWDELNELEISTAPGNRVGAPMPGTASAQNQHRRQPKQPGMANKTGRAPRPNVPQPNNRPNPAPEGALPGKKPARKFFKRPAKPKAPAAASE